MARIWGPYGDDINTDLLFAGKYTYLGSNPEDIIPHLLEDLDPEFAGNAVNGDILVAGANFGCGSSRNQPAVGFKALDMTIIAISYSRIFFRASINLGLPLISCPEAVAAYAPGKSLQVDPENAVVLVDGIKYAFKAFDPYVKGILAAGGLIPYVRAQID
ncbi:3-isopropylmalate dehydratase [bacterium]|nr:3-isopropylmalate dehydratase [candidate division CSSED10-310 bacterium]